MSTLKERFAEKFMCNCMLCQEQEHPLSTNAKTILSFIQAELLLLAEEVEKDPSFFRVEGVKYAAALIRSRAELN